MFHGLILMAVYESVYLLNYKVYMLICPSIFLFKGPFTWTKFCTKVCPKFLLTTVVHSFFSQKLNIQSIESLFFKFL